ncbi:MAG: hypothetical protein E5Y06_00780 [Mesorhizobium sp.]|uniref:hypothetical protein n=1 Tax=Mesorhizobium sp. TaxID=1871066 RepID=UPI001204C64D|nr:hypothetical protein [Mesorhizobium sp.]TIN98510.1 MAG: hypothetical protein E5Y06_00780 [Mesorhizobium sp.]TJU99099.1 MAG: hypothetical protein E5Y08_09465 [Mesorhizobium sp.]
MLHSTIADDSRLLARLKAARETVAQLVVKNADYAPLFERIEADIAAEEAKAASRNPVDAARAIIAARRSGAGLVRDLR